MSLSGRQQNAFGQVCIVVSEPRRRGGGGVLTAGIAPAEVSVCLPRYIYPRPATGNVWCPADSRASPSLFKRPLQRFVSLSFPGICHSANGRLVASFFFEIPLVPRGETRLPLDLIASKYTPCLPQSSFFAGWTCPAQVSPMEYNCPSSASVRFPPRYHKLRV